MSTTGGLLGIETTTQEFAQKLAEVLPVTIASVALWDRPSFSLTIKAVGTARPLDVPLPLLSRVSLATAPTHRAAFERQEPIFLDLEAASARTAREEVARALVPDLRAIYLLPIRVSDETVGVLGLGEMRSAEREPMSSEKRERCRTILEEFLATSAHAWEAGRLRQQLRAMASLLRMVRETLDARTNEDVLAMCASEAGGWLGAPVRAILFRVGPSGDIAVAAKYRFPEPVTSADGAQLMLALARNRTQTEWPVGVASVADDPLDTLRTVMPEGGRWTRITLPLMNVGQLLGLICLYIEDELQLTQWELEAFRYRAEIASHAYVLVSTLEDHAHERAWFGRAAYETLSTGQRIALREALKGIDRLVGTLLPDRIQRLVGEGGASGVPAPREACALAEAVTREVSSVLEGLCGEESSTVASWEVDLNGLVRRVMGMARASLEVPTDPHRGPVRLSLQLESGPLVVRTTPELVGALVHAIQNAVEAMPEGGEVRVRTGRENGHALILVQDSGPGVALPENAFMPLVSTKGKPHMGLGLSVIRRVVNRHGGSASLVTSAEGGALLEIRLPLSSGDVRHTGEEA
jgi:hypothetical protein